MADIVDVGSTPTTSTTVKKYKYENGVVIFDKFKKNCYNKDASKKSNE